jgi:hypothetical protein
MRHLENIKAIIIPTCDYLENLERAKKALEFSRENGLPKRCVLSGLGSDTNIALGDDETQKRSKLNFHRNLYANKNILENQNK